MADGKPTPIADEDLKELSALREKFADTSIAVGQLEIERIMLTRQLEAISNRKQELERTYVDLLEEEQGLVKKLSEKYGDGRINIEKKEFVPSV